MDRHRLATWSLALDDDGFGQACAALGVLSALAQRGRPARMALTRGGGDAGLDAARVEDAVRSLHAARDEDGIVPWQMPSVAVLARLPCAAELAEAWRRYIADAPWGTRIAVRSRGRSWRGVLPMLPILQLPAVEAGGVFVASTRSTAQGVYHAYNDAVANVAIAAADPTNPRIDRIVVRFSAVERRIYLATLTGTPAETPTAPVLTRSNDTYELGVSDILVPKGSVSIPALNITDTRLNTALCGLVNSLVTAVYE